MDGFFVCKLKIDPVNKGEKRRLEAEAVAVDQAAESKEPPLRMPTSSAKSNVEPETSVFDAEEDDAIMQRSRGRMAKKRRA